MIDPELVEREAKAQGPLNRKVVGGVLIGPLRRKRVGGRVAEESHRRLGTKEPPSISPLSDAEKRELAVGVAADMEMGYYHDAGGQWAPKSYVLDEIIRHLGYSPKLHGFLPVWFPTREAFRRMVALRVTLREVQRHPETEDEESWVKAALSAGVEELLTRLYIRPTAIKDRELIELVTKLARIRAASERPVGAPVALGKSPVAFQRITETYLALPDEERERMKPLYERAIEQAKLAIA